MAKLRKSKRNKDGSSVQGGTQSSATHGGVSIAISGSNQAPINIQTAAQPSGETVTPRREATSAKLELWIPFEDVLDHQLPSQFLQAHYAFVPMVGRGQDLADLQSFLKTHETFRFQVLFGDAGVGKTRLAIEFLKQAASDGWNAGFLDADRMKDFITANGFAVWQPDRPTLVVIDYAASKLDGLRRIFSHFASLELPDKPAAKPVKKLALRVLLLERQADLSQSWFEELLSLCEGQVGDRLRNFCFDGLKQLQPLSKGLPGAASTNFAAEVIRLTFLRWETIKRKKSPAVPSFSEKEWRLIQINTGSRPLYLQMAALNACEHDSAKHLLTWGRTELIAAAIKRDRDYIKRECTTQELRKAVEHAVAVLCLTGAGFACKPEWLDVLENELVFLKIPPVLINQVDQKCRLIFGDFAEKGKDTGVAPIQPDILAAGFAASVLSEEKRPIETLTRVLQITGSMATTSSRNAALDWVWPNILRMAQDLSRLKGFEQIDVWLPALLDKRPVEELRQMAKLIPDRSVSLHKFGLLVNEHLVKHIPQDNLHNKATCLLDLATHLSRGETGDPDAQQRAANALNEAIQLFTSLLCQPS
jgi:hypothetical protein